MDTNSAPESPRYIRSRVANACDGCKARKVKCDGQLPCSYCAERQRPQTCHYSVQRRRRTRAASPVVTEAETERHPVQRALPRSPPTSTGGGLRRSTQTQAQTRSRGRALPDEGPDRTPRRVTDAGNGASVGGGIPTISAEANGHAEQRQSLEANAEDETDVPREARLLCDAHGKLIFIGDCAPLSFFQSVRQLVTTRVGQNAFAPQTSRYSVLENAPPRHPSSRLHGRFGPPDVRPSDVTSAVSTYLTATAGLVDLFDDTKLLDDLLLWANLDRRPEDVVSVVNYLVLAIGRQMDDEELSQVYFEYARDQAYGSLSGNLGVGTVQAFALITVYMLCSCQINGAFLFFGIAVRAAYSVGVHRTEVNARFGLDIHRQRDRLWKSLRVVDLFLSTSMGRPPATSDVDCTVPYRSLDTDGNEEWDLLNASVQILLITEGIVLEIYSRRKISLQLTEGVSRQLRDWSIRWLQQLKDVITRPVGQSDASIVGACQVLSSYYYAVMLVSRPFLMYELCRRLSDGPSSTSRSAMTSGKSKLADACIDAASLMVDPILDLIQRNALNGRVPLLVSWLFASSLVLGVGLLGGFGRILEKYTRMSIQALDHFAKTDGHAAQYSLIAQSLLTTALEHLEQRELQDRLRRTENSSQLFGLIPNDTRSTASTPTSHHRDPLSQVRTPAASTAATASTMNRGRDSLDRSFWQHQGLQGVNSPRLGDIDAAFLGLGEGLLQTPDGGYWNGEFADGDSGAAMNLFPLLESGGGIDLAHYL